MSLRTPGFTQLENLDQADINAKEMFTNLFSGPLTKGFTATESGGDLNVFRNNVNNTSTYTHFNRVTQGDTFEIASAFGVIGGFLFAGRLYFQLRKPGSIRAANLADNNFHLEFPGFTDSQLLDSPADSPLGRPELKPSVFGFEGFINPATGEFDFTDWGANTVHTLSFGPTQPTFIGIPGRYFEGHDSPPGPKVLPTIPAGIQPAGSQQVKVFSSTAVSSTGFKTDFVDNELRITAPLDTELFTDGDIISKVTLTKGPVNLAGSFTIAPADAYLANFSPSDSPSGTRGFGAFGGTYEYRSASGNWQHISDSPESNYFFSLNSSNVWEFNYNNNKVQADASTTYPWQATWGNFQAFSINNSPGGATFDTTGVTLPDLATTFEFDGTVKNSTADFTTGLHSYIIGGKTFTSSEQTNIINAFDSTSIVVTRKNGVTQANFLNSGEYDLELYKDKEKTLKDIDKDDTFESIFNSINNSIDSAKLRTPGHILRRDRTELNRGVNIEGVIRFRDTTNLVTEANSSISSDAPGIFILQNSIDDSPQLSKRAFSETSALWQVNNTNNNIELKNDANVTLAKVDGKLIFEEAIAFTVDHDSPPNDSPPRRMFEDDSPAVAGGRDANGQTSDDFNESLQAGVSSDTFTHRMILEVDELDDDGSAITTEYSILAVRKEVTGN